MTIQINISQRSDWLTSSETHKSGCPRRYWFNHETNATFSLDGNPDIAQMMAGYAVAGIIRAHRGDVLLVTVQLHGKLVARWVGEASDKAADEFDTFLPSRRLDDFNYTARRLAA